MESELADVPMFEERRKELERTLRLKEGENDRMTDAYSRGVVDLDTLEEHIKRSRLEIALQAEYMGRMAEESSQAITVDDIANTGGLLRALQDTIEDHRIGRPGGQSLRGWCRESWWRHRGPNERKGPA